MLSFDDLKKDARRQLENDKKREKASTTSWESLKQSARQQNTIGIDQNYISSFFTDAQNYLRGASESYNGMGYANRESVFTSQKKTADDLRSRSGQIRAYLNGNKASLKEEDYNSLIAILDDFDNSSASIYDAFSKKNEGISQFASEYAYTEFLRQNELEGMTADEIQAARGSRVSDEDKGIIHELMLSNMPYSREHAQQDGRDMGLYDEVEQKRKYISDKYGVNLYEDIYNNGKIFTDLINDDVIAYTTMDGRNVTWDSLLQNAQQSEDLANRLSTYSANADWAEKSKKIQTVADTESDYSIVYEVLQSLVPYDWKTAEANGIDRGTFDAIERKRRYISEKYGVDLYSDIYSNFDTLSNILVQLDGQEGEKETFENISYLTSDEKAVLSYIYETEGRAAALAWHKSRMNIYDERFRNSVVTGFKNIGEESPFWGSVGSVALSLGSGVEYLTDVFNYMATGEDPYNTMALASSSIRSGVMEKVDWEIGNWDAFDFVYGAGMSMADSAAAMATMGNFGGIGLGLSAAAQATNDALDRGMSSKQAFWNGLMSGTFECLFESWSIGNFQALKEVASAHGRDIAKNIAKSMLVNASEETLTEIANIVYDTVFNGDFSEYETSIRKYMAMGMTEEEATKKAIYEKGIQVAEAAGSGALMGLGFGGIGSGRAIAHNAASSAQSAQQTYSIGKQIRDAEGGIDALSALAAEVAGADSKLSEQAKNLKGDVAAGTGFGKVVAGAKNMGRNWKAGQVYRGVKSSVADQTKTDVAAALQNAGLSNRSAKHLADAVVANMNGKQLTNFQRSTLELYEGNEKVGEAISKAVAGTEQRIGEFAKDITAGRISKATGTSLDAAKKAVRGEVYTNYDVSGDGVTTDKDGNAVNIVGVESTENGKLLLKTENGTIDSGDVVYASEADALVYEAVANMGATPASAWDMIKAATEEVAAKTVTLEDASKKYGAQAQAMIHTYTAGQDVAKYDQGYQAAYDMGKSGVAFSYIEKSPAVSYLTDSQKQLAYEAGQAASNTEAQALDAKNKAATNGKTGRKKGTVRGEGVTISDLKKTFNDTQGKAYKYLSTVAEVTGIDIVLYRSEAGPDGKFQGAQGRYSRSEPGTVYIDLNAGLSDINSVDDLAKYAMLRTFAHEFTHFIEKWNPIQYNELRKVVFDTLTQRGENVHDLIEDKQARNSGMSYDKASREVVAEAMTDVLPDANFVQELAENHKTIFQKLLDQLKEFVANLRDYFNSIGYNSSKEANALKEQVGETVKYLDSIVQLFDNAAVQAVENYQQTVATENNTDGGIKNGTERAGQSTEALQGGREASISEMGSGAQAEDGNRSGISEAVGEEESAVREVLPGLENKQKSLTEEDFIVPPRGSALHNAQEAFEEYGIECHIVKSSSWTRESAAYAYKGNVYISEQINEATLSTAVPHEATHVMKQRGFKPYLEFIEKTPDLLDMQNEAAREIIMLAAEHRGLDVFSLDDTQLKKLYDEINATVYGVSKGGVLDNSEYDYGEWIPTAFHDFKGYIKALDNIHEQYKKQFGTKQTMVEEKASEQQDAYTNLADQLKQYTHVDIDGIRYSAKAKKEGSYYGNIKRLHTKAGGVPVENARGTIYSSYTPGFATREEAIADLVVAARNNKLLGATNLVENTKPKAEQALDSVDEDSVQEQSRSYHGEDFYDTDGVHWGIEAGIMTNSEARRVWEAIANIGKRGYSYPRTVSGEHIISADNALFFVNTDYRHPSVNKIVRFNEEYNVNAGYAKEMIIYARGNPARHREAMRDVADLYGDGFAIEYDRAIYAENARENREGEGRNRRTSDFGIAEQKQGPVIKPESIKDQFSLNNTVEETADLLAMHNITLELLVDTLSRGSLIMPSVAVTNKAMVKFGEISLVFDKNTIDPIINTANRLYGADAWTPNQTEIKKNAKFDTNETVKAVNSIKNQIGSKFVSDLFDVSPKQFKAEIINANGSIYDAYANNIGMQTAYAMEQGFISEVPINETGFINTEALQNQLDRYVKGDRWRQYKKWLNNISDTIITSYDKASNEDILTNMKAQPATAKPFKLSVSGDLVVPAAEYFSINDVRKNKNRLSENAEEVINAVANEFLTLASRISNNTEHAVDAINATFKDRYSTADIVRSFESKGIKISSKTASEIQALYKKAVELPSQYFEAKPGREVGLNEIKAAVIPSDASYAEIKAKLEKLGIRVIEYDGSKESREEALNSVEDVKFQQRTNTLTDREVLALAASQVKVSDMTAAEKDALDIFQQRLSKLEALQTERAEQGRLYKEQQFGAKVDRAKAAETLNRMHVLDGQIQKASAEVLTVEEKTVLKRVLQKAKTVVEQQEREHGQEILKRWRDRRNNADAIKKYRDRLRGDVDELTNWVLHPDNKNVVKHIPDALKNTVIPFLSSINFMSKRSLAGGNHTHADKALMEQTRRLAKVMENTVDIDEIYSNYTDLPPDFMNNLRSFIDTAQSIIDSNSGDFIINQMTAEELQKLSKVVRTLKKYIMQMNRFHVNSMFKHVYEAGENSIDFLAQLKPAENTGAVSNFLLWQQMRPAYAFERFGDGGQAIYDGLRRGQATLAFNTKKIQSFAEKAYTTAEVKAWENQVKTIRIGPGKTVTMPVSYIMGLYELNKREQAQGHIFGEGIRVATFKANGKKISDIGQTLTPGELNMILRELTPRQKEVADKLQQFMEKQGGEWGNYVTVARFGEKQFGEPNYYPINSDGRHLSVDADEKPGAASLYALLNMGFTKQTQEKAKNRLIVYSIFDVFSNHMASMAQYNAFALPVVDALKWFNYQRVAVDEDGSKTILGSVREQMDRAFGVPEENRPGSGRRGYAQNFVINIVKALNGTEAQGTPYDGFGMNALHHYNRAQVAYNLRVVVQQPMAITRAAQLLDYSSILKGMKLLPAAIRKNIQEMQQYSGIAAWKSLGFYDVNISRGLTSIIKHDDTAMDKIVDVGMKGAETADTLTWAAMWSACKEEVIRKQKLTPKSEGFYEAVTKLFEDVVYKTQVVDSVLTKNEFMRDKGFFARAVGSFMSEPTATASMLVDAYDKYHMDMQRGMNRQQAWKKNSKMIVRTAYVYGIGAAILAAVQAVADAFRDDDDYQEWYEKWLEAFGGNLVDELMPFNKLPILSDFYDLAKELLSKLGVDTYGNPPQSVFMQWYDSLVKGVEILHDKISGADTSYTWYGGAYKLLQAASGMTGLPMAGATREIVTAWNNIVGAMAPSLKVKTYDPGEKNEIKYAYQDGYLTAEEAAEQLLQQGVVDTEDEAYWTIQGWEAGAGYSRYDAIFDAVRNSGDFNAAMRELTSHGYAEKDVLSQVKGKIYEWYKGGEITKQQATNMLTKYIGGEEVQNTIGEWAFEAEHPELDGRITYTQYKRWETDGKPNGVSLDTFTNVADFRDDGTSDSVKSQDEVAAYINSLNISTSQKDALWCCFWKKSTLKNAPWH